MIDSTGDLLASLDPLPFGRRLARVARWARDAPDRAVVCAGLRELGPYERSLAVHAAVVAGAADEVLAALDDPDAGVRGQALQAALRAGWLTEPALDLPAADRRLIYRTLRAVRAPETAGALLPRVRDRYGDTEAAALLPGCGDGLVRRLLPELDHAVNLTALARRHPGPLLDHVAARLEAAEPPLRRRIWDQVGHAVLRCPPARVLDLLERYAPEDRLPGNLARYGPLAAHDPHRVAALLADSRRASWVSCHSLSRAVLRRLIVLSDEELLPLGRQIRQGNAWAALLKAMPPSRRGGFFDRVQEDIGPANAIPSTSTMEVLPHAVRAREARRALGRPWARDNEAATLTWSAYLLWPDARAALQSALTNSDAEVRARGYQLLIDAARRSRDPGAVAEAVAALRLRNERDPVRSAALGALARVAPLVTAGLAPALTRLTTGTAEARDVSAQSLGALGELAAGVLRHHLGEPALRDWALFTVDLVSAGPAVPSNSALGRFDRTLRRGQESMVFDRLRGWVEAGMARGRYEPLFALVHALGARARLVPELQELLRRAISPGVVHPVVRTAIGLWLADPRARAGRVAEVLDLDASAVAVAPVWKILCAERTDLLDRVLGEAPRGRFVQDGVRWVPPWPEHAGRWLPRQHAAFAELQLSVAEDPGATPARRAGAVAAAARVPVLGSAIAQRYARSDEVVIAEAALSALAWPDRPEEAMTTLLRHAGDDRARVAMYAVSRVAGLVAPSRLPALPGEVLRGSAKVTSRKEAARLLGRYGPAESMGALLHAYREEGTHRDVRAAIVASARNRLWSAPSWTVLEEGVRGSRAERLGVLAAGAAGVAERDRARYAQLIVTACRSTDREVRREAFTRLPEWGPWIAGLTGLVSERLADLGEEVEHYEAGPLIQAVHADGLQPLWEHLTAFDAADDEGNADRDRPAWHRLDELAQAVVSWSNRADSSADRGPALAAARWLAGRPAHLAPAVRMIIGLGRLECLDEAADLIAHRPVLAWHAARWLQSQMPSYEAAADPAGLLALAADLGRRGDLARGLFAVQLAGRGFRHGWTVEWRDLLRSLRHHPDPDVRDEATSIAMNW